MSACIICNYVSFDASKLTENEYVSFQKELSELNRKWPEIEEGEFEVIWSNNWNGRKCSSKITYDVLWNQELIETELSKIAKAFPTLNASFIGEMHFESVSTEFTFGSYEGNIQNGKLFANLEWADINDGYEDEAGYEDTDF